MTDHKVTRCHSGGGHLKAHHCRDKNIPRRGPRFIRAKARSGRGGSRPDDFAWILSRFSPTLVEFCEIFCLDYHFEFHFWPQQCLNSKKFQCCATCVQMMHLAFLKKSPVLSGFPPSIFPKFDEICLDWDLFSALINRGPPRCRTQRQCRLAVKLPSTFCMGEEGAGVEKYSMVYYYATGTV